MQKAHLKTTGRISVLSRERSLLLALYTERFSVSCSYRFKLRICSSRKTRGGTLRFFVRVGQVPEKTLEFVRVEIVVHGRGRNGVRGWTLANRAFFFFFFTCKSVSPVKLKWNGRGVVGVSDKSV